MSTTAATGPPRSAPRPAPARRLPAPAPIASPPALAQIYSLLKPEVGVDMLMNAFMGCEACKGFDKKDMFMPHSHPKVV